MIPEVRELRINLAHRLGFLIKKETKWKHFKSQNCLSSLCIMGHSTVRKTFEFWVINLGCCKRQILTSTLFYTQNKTNGIPLLNDPWVAARNENGMRDGDKTRTSMHIQVSVRASSAIYTYTIGYVYISNRVIFIKNAYPSLPNLYPICPIS